MKKGYKFVLVECRDGNVIGHMAQPGEDPNRAPESVADGVRVVGVIDQKELSTHGNGDAEPLLEGLLDISRDGMPCLLTDLFEKGARAGIAYEKRRHRAVLARRRRNKKPRR